MRNPFSIFALAAALAALPAAAAQAADPAAFPAKAVTVVVPFAAGQSGDILARVLSEGLSRRWGQSVVVENRGGAGGTLGTRYAAAAQGDGHTLLLASSGPLAIAPNLYKDAGYDPRRDFVPIMNVAGVSQVLVVSAASPYRSAADLVAAAKADPGKLSYGSGGAGSTQHLTMELFKQRAGIAIQHVPYRGSAPAYTDLFGGRIDAMFDSLPAALPFAQSGQARILAVSTAQRDASLPDVPTVEQSGYAGFDVLGWLALVAPKGLDPAVRDKINADVAAVMATDAVKARLQSLGMQAVGGSADDFGRYIDSELRKWGEVIKTGNIVLE